MDYRINVDQDINVDYKQVFWDILSRWKIVLIVALSMSIFLSIFKYKKDQASYMSNIAEEQLNSELVKEEDADTYLKKMLQTLPEKERDAVMYLIGMQEEVLLQQSYLSESILMNATPTNQRCVLLNYYLKTAANVDIQAISDSYIQALNDRQVSVELGKLISPNVDSKYVMELINVTGGALPDSEITGQLLRVKVVLTKEADISAIERVITNTFKEKNKLLVDSMGEHTINLVDSTESYRYAIDVLDKKASLYNGMSAAQNNIKNFYQQLNDEQKKIIDIAMDLLRKDYSADVILQEVPEATISSEKELGERPRFRPEFAVIGFVLGIIMYAFIYVVSIILKEKLITSNNAAYYTNSRLIGEIACGSKEYRGLDALTHSRMVDSLRYRGRKSIEEQIEQIASRILAVCNHSNVPAVTVVCLTGGGSGSIKMTERIRQGIADKGLKAEILAYDIDRGINENDMLDVNNAVSVVDGESRPQSIKQMLRLYKEYDTKQLGCVYLGEI